MKRDNIVLLENKYTAIKEKNEKIKTKISYFRLLIFALFVIFLALSFMDMLWSIAPTVVCLGGFICLSVYHHRFFVISDNASFKLTVLKQYKSRFDDSFKKNSDNGLDLKSDAYFESDLDVFGKSSLFSYLCFAKTPYGRYFLAQSLKGNIIDSLELKKRQTAIHELANDFENTIDIEANGAKFQKASTTKKISKMENAFNLLSNDVPFNYYKLIINVILIAALIVSIVFAALKKISIYSPLIVLVVNFVLCKMIYNEINPIYTSIITINDAFYGYNYLLDSISNKEFKSDLLNQYKNQIVKLNSKSIKSFKRISGLISSRNNLIFQVLFNGTVLFDGLLVALYKNWQKKYENDFKDALIAVGNIEELISLATIEIVKETATLPVVSDKEFTFEDIKHPLITEEKCIGNSFEFEGTNIISGSNMSGKTTFMRSIGVNYLLFLSGAYVSASTFKAPICRLFTSMKVVDDVNNNISTFYGEILRVKDICQYINEEKPMIVLVDEIFKGTNTKDRITGATAFVKKLLNSKAYTIITTHDHELCDIKGVNNYYFLEHYKNDEIAFDYKIRHGISTTRNAIYLLKMAGVIDKEESEL